MDKRLDLLLKKQEYDQIIELTAMSVDGHDLAVRLVALAETGRDDEALRLITDKFMNLQAFPGTVFPIHANILKSRGDRLAGYAMLKMYQELPYDSIVVEEAMRDFATWLETKPAAPTFSFAHWHELISSDSLEDHLKAVSAIPKRALEQNLEEYLRLLLMPYAPEVRLVGLFRLIDIGLNKTVAYQSVEFDYELMPSFLEKPEAQDEFCAFAAHLKAAKADPTFSGMALDLLLQYANAVFPSQPPYEDETHLATALFLLVNRYMQTDEGLMGDDIANAIAGEVDETLRRFVSRGDAL